MSHTDLRLSIGILVCEKLYLYFYNHSDNKNDCLEIPFEKDNELGIKLMELFSKNNFDVENTRDFIQSEIKNKNDVVKVKKEISEELVKNLLTEHFIKTYDKDVVESALKGFSFICSERKNMNTGASAVVQNSSVPFTSSGKNNAQFTVNGVPTGGKCPTVRYVIESYVKNNPGITFEQLQEAFPDEAARPGFGKVVRRLEDVKDNEWGGHRFNKHPIILSDGQQVAVSTQWEPQNIKNFIRAATVLGFDISSDL